MIEASLVGKDLYLEIGESLSHILNVELGVGDSSTTTIVHINTTEYWNSKEHFIGEKGHIYVYTDSCYDGETPIPGIKIGDGMSYLIDNAFVSSDRETLLNHINNQTIHITPQERYFWNQKVRCDETTIEGENLRFTKN